MKMEIDNSLGDGDVISKKHGPGLCVLLDTHTPISLALSGYQRSLEAAVLPGSTTSLSVEGGAWLALQGLGV